MVTVTNPHDWIHVMYRSKPFVQQAQSFLALVFFGGHHLGEYLPGNEYGVWMFGTGFILCWYMEMRLILKYLYHFSEL